ncbi:amino acid ABC transporter substrate-binding protein [Phaeacidiphilus oryzae]|uniref:amino acid ABC transporter substrate-binding protein n=1 Tax=Phaeacidiphilus oryzae TaxID=348818 RepID=UPI000689F99C|nr:amino acid ABC transporter substrate-binding protein [Phaeacidiphilus oryzae]
MLQRRRQRRWGRGRGGAAKGPIKVGVSLSLTGDFSADGKAFQQGYQLWAKNVNAAGGLLGRQVTLDIVNDASNPVQVSTNYQKLISVDHVDLVFGPFSTLLTKAASQVVARYGYALVEGAGGGPSVFTSGLHDVFDVSLPVANNLVSFAEWLAAMPPGQRPATAAYASEDDPFTSPQLDRARSILEAAGVKTVYNKIYPSETTDYGPIAAGMIGAKADVVLVGTLLPDVTAFIQQFVQQNYDPKAFIATAGPDQGAQFLKNIGGAKRAQGVMVPNEWYPTDPAPGNAAMVASYLHTYGGSAQDISADVAEAYSVGQVTAQAVTRNGSLDQGRLISELHSGSYQTVQGAVKFDATGQNTKAFAYVFQWQNGRLVPYQPNAAKALTPVPPEKAAVLYPKPAW